MQKKKKKKTKSGKSFSAYFSSQNVMHRMNLIYSFTSGA